MTTNELSTHVQENLPKGFGLFLSLVPGKAESVQLLDARDSKHITETVFHVEAHRGLESTVLDALSHAQAEVAA